MRCLTWPENIKVIPQGMRLSLDRPESAGFAFQEISKKINKHNNRVQSSYFFISSLSVPFMLSMSQMLWQALRI